VASGRLVLGALLGERRIRIYRDRRIEGAVEVAGELRAPAASESQLPAAQVVAGARYAPVDPIWFGDEIEVPFRVAA
jgi:hypothetical protein